MVSPPDIENDLATVAENWGNFGGGVAAAARGRRERPSQTVDIRANLNSNRNTRFDEWIANIKPGRRPALNFKHTLLPHVPWVYLPDGKQYRRTASDPVPGFSNHSYNDQGQVDSLLAAAPAAAGFADRELGELIAHLKRDGPVRQVPDRGRGRPRRGVRVGRRDRRTLTAENAARSPRSPCS